MKYSNQVSRFGFLALAACFFLAGCETVKETAAPPGETVGEEAIGEAISVAPIRMSPDQAHQIGYEMSAALLKRHPLVDDEKITLYLNRVGQYVALHLDNGAKNIKCSGGREKSRPSKGFRFAAIQSNEDLAMSMPGGFIFVSTGLLKKMKTEDELAGVLAHEATHVVCQDGLSEVEAAALKTSEEDGALVNESGDSGQTLAAKASERFFQNPFSRAQEKIADRGGLLATYRGGYYPGDYIDFTETQKDQTSARHPGSRERVGWLKRDFAKMQKKGVVDTKKARAARFAEFKKMIP